MDRLISRYLSQMEEKEEEQIITLDDLENAKKDLISEIVTLADGKRKSLWNKSFLSKVLYKSHASKNQVDKTTPTTDATQKRPVSDIIFDTSV